MGITCLPKEPKQIPFRYQNEQSTFLHPWVRRLLLGSVVFSLILSLTMCGLMSDSHNLRDSVLEPVYDLRNKMEIGLHYKSWVTRLKSEILEFGKTNTRNGEENL